jgi:rod shape-determining protein MreC
MDTKTNNINSSVLFIGFCAVSVVLMFLDSKNTLAVFKSGAESIVNPIKSKISIVTRVLSFTKIKNEDIDPLILQAKIDYLASQNTLLAEEKKALQTENDALKKQLNAATPNKGKLMPAKSLSVLAGVMTIDKGVKDGIKEGMVVVTSDQLVGKINSVSMYSAKVSLPTKDGNTINVKIANLGEKGVVVGTAENRMILDKVLQKAGLKQDQIVLTSGEAGDYPQNLVVGKMAELAPIEDYGKMEVVMIRI